MHCANRDFSTIIVLPPYNTIHAQVIKVGDAGRLPQVITEGLRVTYEIPANTYSVGKTNFWDFEDKLFGVELEPNIGLTGVGLSGEMKVDEDHFLVEGVPLTPYPDAELTKEHPFQLGLLKAYDGDRLLAEAKPVVPVSNEINCVSSGCHAGQKDILAAHPTGGGFDPAATPMLCASCHSSNALGTKGQPGAASLSETIHTAHAERTNDCFKCHPGPTTQCLRGTMATDYGLVCEDCHGTMAEVGGSIAKGRKAWLQEPRCGDESCHGSKYAEEEGKLFRTSRGHGGLFCSTCHGEPHAIYPAREANDNVQSIALQGHAGTISDCTVCHGVAPTGAGPHGVMAGE